MERLPIKKVNCLASHSVILRDGAPHELTPRAGSNLFHCMTFVKVVGG